MPVWLPAMVAALGLLGSTGCSATRLPTVPPAPPLIAAVTWNTHAGRGNLSRLLVDVEQGRLSPRPGAILILLQEAAEDELETVATPRGWFTFFVPVRG